MMPRKVNFRNTPKVPKKINISFVLDDGRRIRFTKTMKVPKKVKVDFYLKGEQERG